MSILQNVKSLLGEQSRSHWNARQTMPETIFSGLIIVEFGHFETREAAWLLHSAVPVLVPVVLSDVASMVLEN